MIQEGKLTVFQRAELAVGQFDDKGQPKERPVYQNKRHGVSALLDPFSPLLHGVVVYPHGATAGEAAHFSALPYSERAIVGLVAHAVGKKLLAIAGVEGPESGPESLRVLERVDGFAVPDHAHVVLGIAARGAEPRSRPTPDQLNESWAKLGLDEGESAILDRQLDCQAALGPILDGSA